MRTRRLELFWKCALNRDFSIGILCKIFGMAIFPLDERASRRTIEAFARADSLLCPLLVESKHIERRKNSQLERRVQNSSFDVIELACTSVAAEGYDNHPIARVNDHEVRMSTMTGALRQRNLAGSVPSSEPA